MRMLEIGPRETPALSHYEDEHDVVYLDAVDRMGVTVVHTLEYPDSPLPFEEGSFGLVVASHVLEHIPYFVEDLVFEDLFRVTAPMGQVHIKVPDGNWIGQELFTDRLDGVFKGFMLGGLIDEFDAHVNVFTKNSLLARMDKTGFKVLQVGSQEYSLTQGEYEGMVSELYCVGVKLDD
jgi:hypothetical protein